MTVDSVPCAGTIMAFDFGLVRIGVATANIESHLTTPLKTLKAVAGKPCWLTLAHLVDECRPVAFIVGRSNAVKGEMKSALKNFVRELSTRYRLKTILYDETATSIEASARIRELRQLGLRRKTIKGDIDKIAAAIILEDYLNSERIACQLD